MATKSAFLIGILETSVTSTAILATIQRQATRVTKQLDKKPVYPVGTVRNVTAVQGMTHKPVLNAIRQLESESAT